MEVTKTQQFLQDIITKAWEDNDFKLELIKNPVKTIETLTGKKANLPEGKTIVVRDQTDASIVYINIPVEPNMGNMELSEEQLEVVAGGSDIKLPDWLEPLKDIFWSKK
ncbi:NHLP leader peptide family RiPP precursor [Tenacibaculum ovolyticum]|uniref:NHLP leader peptide family RiPP precursor n=1 Tax=Tenacibaculum ovolyticum TaxID=104270 RepID=UPI0022F37E50|nr:NHLP leader peptide family RiPP precursor [Tenacibaculum ovolyticum]WBX76786.1 NHLP leader peptide family RiPP precursor [Tenacibaculum ovolyticum]